MKKLTLILLLIGLLSGSAYASLEQEPIESNETKIEPIVVTEKNDSSVVTQDNSEVGEKEIVVEDDVEDVKESSVEEKSVGEQEDGVAEIQGGEDDKFIIDKTTLYYTYSTIAQTLAGAFGILGAFTMFRLQGLNNSIRSIVNELAHGVTDNQDRSSLKQEIKYAYIQEKWKTFCKLMKENPGIKAFKGGSCHLNDDDFQCLIESLNQSLKLRKRISRGIRFSLSITILTILLSVFPLLFIPWIVNLTKISFIFTLFVIIATAICLISYYFLVVNTLDVSKEKRRKQ